MTQDRLVDIVAALRAAQEDAVVLRWVTAITQVLLAIVPTVALIIASRQSRRQSDERARAQKADHDHQHAAAAVERLEQRLREFRLAVADWAAALYLAIEAQRVLIFQLKKAARQSTGEVLQEERNEVFRRVQLVRTSSFRALLQAPTTEWKHSVRRLVGKSNLPSFTAALSARDDLDQLTATTESSLREAEAFNLELQRFIDSVGMADWAVAGSQQ